ncbi:MAG: hypothetical protein AB1894_00345 [Chloroflexota bacterium]
MSSQNPWEEGVRLRGGITIYPSHEKALDRILGELVERCPAAFALLAEISGQLISIQGERGERDLIALASLAAGDLAASQEIARLTGEYKHHQLVLREGEKFNTFISESGPHLLVFVQVANEVPLGWARLLIREATRQLAKVIDHPAEEVEKLDLGLDDDKLSDLMGDALDALWTG